jgi:uncharacterized protein YcgL (UPF0745 family)
LIFLARISRTRQRGVVQRISEQGFGEYVSLAPPPEALYRARTDV